MATDPSSVQLTSEQLFMVAQLADLSGESWPEALGHAIAAYAQAHGKLQSANGGESFADAARRLGLIGCLSGGPPDLSTNPRHFEGFGESDG